LEDLENVGLALSKECFLSEDIAGGQEFIYGVNDISVFEKGLLCCNFI